MQWSKTIVFSASGQSNNKHLCLSLCCTIQANVPFPSHIFHPDTSKKEDWMSMWLWNTTLAERWSEGLQEILQDGGKVEIKSRQSSGRWSLEKQEEAKEQSVNLKLHLSLCRSSEPSSVSEVTRHYENLQKNWNSKRFSQIKLLHDHDLEQFLYR